MERGASDRESERGPAERGPAERGASEYGLRARGSSERGASWELRGAALRRFPASFEGGRELEERERTGFFMKIP